MHNNHTTNLTDRHGVRVLTQPVRALFDANYQRDVDDHFAEWGAFFDGLRFAKDDEDEEEDDQ